MPNESEDPPEAYTGSGSLTDAEILRNKYPELKAAWDLVTESSHRRLTVIKKAKWGPVPINNKAVRVLNKLDDRCNRRLEDYYILEKLLADSND